MSSAKTNRPLRAFLDMSTGTGRLFFCRGTRCAQKDRLARKTKCEDCIMPRDDETMEQVAAKIEKGDA
jgi:hypothetical protein